VSTGRRGGIWYWNGLPVPLTATWSGELDQSWIADCPHAKAPALMAVERPGEGRPFFKRPHPVRQRRAMALCLCDICGRPLRNRTKYLCGNVRSFEAEGRLWPGTSEPLVCSACLPLAQAHCPFVKAATERGERPLIVSRYLTAASVVDAEGMRLTTGAGDYPKRAVCYLKLIPVEYRAPSLAGSRSTEP
jgi:hypothetical protein